MLLDLPSAVVESFSLYAGRFSQLQLRAVTGSTSLGGNQVHIAATDRSVVISRRNSELMLHPLDSPAGSSNHALRAALRVSVAEALPTPASWILLSGASLAPADGTRPPAPSISDSASLFLQSPPSALEPIAPTGTEGLRPRLTAPPEELCRAVAAHLEGGSP